MADKPAWHQEPGAKCLCFLFVIGPAVDIAPTKLGLEVEVLCRRVMEGVVAKLVAGGVALPGARVALMEQDAACTVGGRDVHARHAADRPEREHDPKLIDRLENVDRLVELNPELAMELGRHHPGACMGISPGGHPPRPPRRSKFWR